MLQFFSAWGLAGLSLFAVGLLFHAAVPRPAPGLAEQCANEARFRRWGGWPRAYMAAHPLLAGALFAGAFLLCRGATGRPAAGEWAEGLAFGLALFCSAG